MRWCGFRALTGGVGGVHQVSRSPPINLHPSATVPGAVLPTCVGMLNPCSEKEFQGFRVGGSFEKNRAEDFERFEREGIPLLGPRNAQIDLFCVSDRVTCMSLGQKGKIRGKILRRDAGVRRCFVELRVLLGCPVRKKYNINASGPLEVGSAKRQDCRLRKTAAFFDSN